MTWSRVRAAWSSPPADAGPWASSQNPLEAVRWISRHPERNSRSPLASQVRFGPAVAALDFVKTLYLAGAIEVSVDPDSRNREWVPARGDYVISDRMGANALLVRVPAEPGTPQGVLRLLQMEQDQHGAWVQRMYETGSSVPVVDDEIVRVSWRPQSFI